MSGGAAAQYFSLRWNNHPVNLVSVFTGLYQAESLVDVSLAAEGKHLQAHKVVLSACSDYFQALFAANPCQHPIVILKDVAFEDLQTVVKFMYHGIVNVSSDKLPAVLKTADALQIKGLEKNNELMAPYLTGSSPRGLLSVPGQVRQPSTESLPEYLHQSAMQRSRSDGGSFPHRAHSAESRGLSFDSPLELSRPKRVLSPPPGSNASHTAVRNNVAAPAESGSYARKKFRQRSENTMSLSIEQASETDVKEAEKEDRKSPYSGPSPSFPSQEEHIAKKKRAMFQARKGGSSSGSKSSEMQGSSDGRAEGRSNKQESQSSSSLSVSHSSEKEEGVMGGSCDTLQVPSMAQSRTMVRAASASATESPIHGALATKFKRGRFLQRQQCQEGENQEEVTATVTKSEPPPSPPPPTTAALVKQHSSPVLPYSPRTSPTPAPTKEEPVDPLPPSAPDRQPSLDPLCGLESVPLLYSSSGPRPHPTIPNHTSLFRPSLPAVRITTEPASSGHELVPLLQSPHGHHLSPCHSPGLLYPGVPAYDQVSPPLHQQRPIEDKKMPTPNGGCSPPVHPQNMKPRPEGSVLSNHHGVGGSTQALTHAGGYPVYQNSGGHQPPLQLAPMVSPRHFATAPAPPATEQFGHCPKAREGPALSCNFCWNTTDGSGRILRRKTKYHCPECQTNLCIVPCFQQYHEAMENENSMIQQ